jgi:hypothetical protein
LAVSRELVKKIRDQLVKSNQIPNNPGRVGSDGKLYTTAGLPKDENERLPRDNKQAGADDEPAERSRRTMTVSTAPWEETKSEAAAKVGKSGHGHDAPPFDREARDAAMAVPVNLESSTIDEMLELMARQVNEVVTWTKAEGFVEAYRTAGANARGLFQTAVFNLAARAERLRKG